MPNHVPSLRIPIRTLQAKNKRLESFYIPMKKKCRWEECSYEY